MKSKYFQIGFNKCGTTSIHRFFQANGIRSIHFDRGRLAMTMDANLRQGRYILTGYEKYAAFSDMDFLAPHLQLQGFKHYDKILQQVPNAKFILNVRDIENWIASRLKMGLRRDLRATRPARGMGQPYDVAPSSWWYRSEPYAQRYQTCFGLKNLEEVVACWRADWHAHLAAVQEDIPPSRLLVFNIETDAPEALCRFAGLDDAAALHYKQENATIGNLARGAAQWVPHSLMAQIPESVKSPLKRFLVKF